MTTEPTRHLISVDEFERMIGSGVYADSPRLELVNGEIIEMSPIGERHASKVDRLTRRLITLLGEDAIVRVQGPIRLDDFSRPEPDLAVLKPEQDFYESRLPTAQDVLLLIEVSDSSLRYDRDTKLPLYAAAAIPVVWIVDVEAREVLVFAEPIDGSFTTRAAYASGSLPSVRSLAALEVDVRDIF